jgi:hypothetical protein
VGARERSLNAIEVIKKVAEDEVKKLHTLELGTVTSAYQHSSESDKDNYECNIKLKNRDLELRKVPIATQMIGLAHAPNVGDLVLISFVNGNINAPVVIGRLYNDESRAPLNKTEEVFIFEAATGGAVIKINKNGDITIKSNADITITASGNLNLTGATVNIN